MSDIKNIVLENSSCRLILGGDGEAKSLVLKATGEECLDTGRGVPFFTLTQKRPFNNEVKLGHPNKRTTFEAKSIRLDGSNLIVYFELVTFGATVEVDIHDEYVIFRLGNFIITDKDFCVGPSTTKKLNMDIPPVDEFRLLSMPVKKMENFGEWLNVTWDNGAAVAVIATMPETRINHEKRGDGLVLTADAVRGIKLVDCSAALIVTEGKESMLDAIDALEEELDLPRGVKSRRSGKLNISSLWTTNANLTNIDKIISIAKAAGTKAILFYYKCFFKESSGYKYCGDYDYNDSYPNGEADVAELLRRVKAAGIIPGLHFLHTHIGISSKYVTPVADHRLHLTRHFTLARPLGTEDTTVYVEEPTTDAPVQEDCRVLQFGGELISYEGYIDEYPYAFFGCKRGHFDTCVTDHPIGQIGGTLDVSEFGATSVYVNQLSSLQDEIANKIARIYDLGFEYCYFDGSEGTNEPFDYHVSNAQYRVLKKLKNPPIYAEGAAKTHFGWHWLSGGNAFDVFPCDTFKKLIIEFPFTEAKHMREDFTRVNFGWWQYYKETQPDIYEFGISRAAAWDCPIAVLTDLSVMDANPRTKDNLEVLRRWEQYKAQLTEEEKLDLRNAENEHTLLKTKDGYSLIRYDRVNTPNGITAYVFDYGGKSYATVWHNTGEISVTMKLSGKDISYRDEFIGKELPIIRCDGEITISVADKAYLSGATREELVLALESCKIK